MIFFPGVYNADVIINTLLVNKYYILLKRVFPFMLDAIKDFKFDVIPRGNKGSNNIVLNVRRKERSGMSRVFRYEAQFVLT